MWPELEGLQKLPARITKPARRTGVPLTCTSTVCRSLGGAIRKHRLGLLVSVCLLVATAIPGWVLHTHAGYGGDLDAPQADYQAWPSPGIYVFFDWTNMDPAVYPFITGGHEVATWSGVEGRAKGQYDWSWLDGWITANAASGKPVGLGFNTYDGQCCSPPHGHWLPEWFIASYPDGYVTCQDGAILPKYWSNTYLTHFGNWIRAAASRYDNDPRVAWVEISSGIYGETTPVENQYDACLVGAGLTSELWVETVNAITDLYLSAWRNKPLLIQYAPYFLDRRERREFSDYAGVRGVGMKHNKLLVDHNDQIIDDPDYAFYRAGQYDPLFTFAGQAPSAWEAYRLYFSTPSDTLWGFLNGMNKHPTYVLVTRSLLVTNDPLELKVLDFVNRYAGRTLQDTPGVWVALRETRETWYPQRGNFDFWLYQNDDAPGGRTIPLWDVGVQPEGRYTRRTDQANDNPYMAFDIDNGYLHRPSSPVSITITYLDQGFDAWVLQYDAYGSNEQVAGRVQKTNTGTWRTVTFVLTDAELADGMPGGGRFPGSDFRIWSAGDGDEIVHFVEVRKQAVHGSPTPTPYATPTPSPAPTPTNTPAPEVTLDAPHASQAPAIDGDLSDWPAGQAWRLDRHTASMVHPRSAPEPADSSALLRAAWSETTLYLAAVISDSQHVADSVDIWRDDSMEIGIDGAHDHTPDGLDDHQLTVSIDGRLTDFGNLAAPGGVVATRQYATHYTVEIALPVNCLGQSRLVSAQTLGMTLGLHDDDDGGDWDSYLVLAGDNTYSSAFNWGDLRLLTPVVSRISGHIWYDLNGNGFRDPSESQPISDIAVSVLDAQGAIAASTQSDAAGNWSVDGLAAGQYTVLVEAPSGVLPTTAVQANATLPGVVQIDFGFLVATAVTLQRFEVEATAGTTTLRWQTSHEADNLGFMVYRLSHSDNLTKPLTLHPLPSQAPPGGGADYALNDPNVTPGQRYSYWIECVPGADRFGPVAVLVPLPAGQRRLYLPLL